MKFGVLMFATDTSMSVVDLGRAAEERGMESLFLPEHSHIPLSRRTPFPGGADLPEEYRRSIDPLVGLAAVASVTSTLLLGTGVCLVVQRDPIQLAKEISTLDLISGGRVLCGVGAGWNLEEMADHGTDPARRFALLRERIEAMKEIWTREEAEFHGSLVDFDPMWQWPKPVQRPHPPIMLGGHGPRAIERVVDYADEWFPTAWRDPAELGARIALLQAMAADRGRGPVPVGVFGVPRDVAAIERYAAPSASTAVCSTSPPPGPRRSSGHWTTARPTQPYLDFAGAGPPHLS